MQLRDTNDFTSDQSKEYSRRTSSVDFANCGKCGRKVVDTQGVEVKITSEEEIRLSPSNIDVLDYTFKVCKKCILRLVGGGGAVLKIKYGLEEEEG